VHGTFLAESQYGTIEKIMKIMLLNDTASVPHIGCQAVSDAHARMLGQAGHAVVERFFLGELRRFTNTDEKAAIDSVLADDDMRERLERCDAVVVNGEGTLHHGSGTEYFAVLGAAQQLGKASLIVNAVFEAHQGWAGVLSKLDDFCVRDSRSRDCAKQAGFHCRILPDSLLAAQFDDAPYVDLNDKVVVTDWHPARDHDVGETMRGILKGIPNSFYFPLLHGIHAHTWRGAIAGWAKAGWIVTARHHGVYMAAVAGKPFVALPSNTLKVQGLLEAADVKIPICTTTSEVIAARAYSLERPEEYQKLRDYLNSFLPLQTFSVLGTGTDSEGAAVELDRLQKQLTGRSNSASLKYWGLGNGDPGQLRSLG
jgi:polysaccharide pyruvyl transferase WcaK-like protein